MMKQVLKRIKKEMYEYAAGTVEFSVPRISLTARKNEKLTGEVTIKSSLDQEFVAYLYSSHYRMELCQGKITGSENTISYLCDTAGMEEGDMLKGEIILISNGGQFLLPFDLAVTEEVFSSSVGPVKNLFHFANMAKTDWNQSVSFFYSQNLSHILKGNDRQYRMSYEGLSKYKGNQQNMEEFLLAIHKKQPMEYSFDQPAAEFEGVEGKQQEFLVIERNGWGYSRLFVRAEGAFLQLEKEELSEADFLGNRCRLPYYIDAEKLHEGHNVGKICLLGPLLSLEYPVTVKNQKHFGKEFSYRWEMKKLTLQLFQLYVDFRIQKLSEAVWMKSTKEVVDNMLGLNTSNIEARLFQAQLLITEEKFNEAKWVLQHVEDMIEEHGCEEETYGYFFYVTSLYDKTEETIKLAAETIERLLSQNPESPALLWMLFYLKEEYEADDAKRYMLLEEAYKRGVNSPILYVEVYLILRKSPAYLARLGSYEKQVIAFLAKHDLLGKEIIDQVVYLAGKEKEYSDKLFGILKICYEKNKDNETLGIICNLLIRGNRIGEEAFFWYDLAIGEELRITRLYEYYMLSLDKKRKELLPKTLLLYFSYECTMDYENTAYIYANITAHKEELPELFFSYEKQIEAFVAKQIQAGHINENLAYLYKRMLGGQMITQELAESLADLLFLYEVTVVPEDIKQVVVLCGQLEGERSYPLQDKRAQIPLYTEDYMIFLEDKWGNRYCSRELYQMKRFLQPEMFLSILEEKVENHTGFFLYMSHEHRDLGNIQPSHMHGYRLLLKDERIKKSYKKGLFLKIIPYLYEKDAMEELDHYLSELEPDYFNRDERAEMISYMVIRDMHEKAYETICRLGFEGVRIKTLLQICSFRLEETDSMDEKLLALCQYVFQQNKHNKKVLAYLEKYARGNPRYLRDIWRTVTAAGMEAYELSERILLTCLFGGCFLSGKEEVFSYYFAGKPDWQVVEGYLSESAYEYFVKEQVMDERIFGDMIAFYKQNGTMPQICMLAFLKYFSAGKGILSLEEKQMAEKFLLEMLKKDIFFPFFLRYKNILPIVMLQDSYTYIEYRGEPGCKAVIHYVIEKDGNYGSKYHNEEMEEIYSSIFLKRFVLFFGERLQYYITEEVNGKENLTESGTIEGSNIVDEEPESRFKLLNSMAMSRSLEEYESMETIADEYAKKVWQCERLFPMK
ncbi:MAG: hypothetical protein HDR22_06205 [Lachnospiraceae bacterium]|nr:hypothetical protein [Lachnospiraceae bacterium]